MEGYNATKGISYNAEQLAALDAIKTFVSGDEKVFILRGYAGTGKTTLMREVVQQYCDSFAIMAMAPTGRAAHVLGERIKIGATTIHRGIYSFEDLIIRADREDMADAEIKLVYPIRVLEMPTLVIVDEASMICNVYAEGELWTFGTNRLLNDLLTFVMSNEHSKVIFVGDSAQLPPVGEASSKALDPDFFADRGIKVNTATLSRVMRQDEGLILRNATATRHALENNNLSHLVFEEGEEMRNISANQVVELYTTMFPHPQMGDSAIICYSNAQAATYNAEIRKVLYGAEKTSLQYGDLLMVVANHYDRDMQRQGPPLDVMNGEYAKVVSINNSAETRTTSVFVKRDGTSIKEPVSITYLDVTLQLQNGELYDCKIITNLLESEEKGLNIPQIKARYIDFCIRHPKLRPKTTEFKAELQSDPYMNAIMVKYGYAITCHKAQGGEWNTVFVDFSGVVLCKNGLRWIYTAVTRAKKRLYGVNLPQVKPMDKLKLNAPTQMLRLPSDWPQATIPTVEERCENSAYYVVDSQELPYRHRYTISDGTKKYLADMIYNKQGTITSVQCACEELKALLSATSKEAYPPLNYTPSTPTAQYLYETMVEACEHSGAEMVEVKEYLEHYHILYMLLGDDKITIDFFFKANGFITYATPAAIKGLSDSKLNNLLAWLNDNAR